MQHFPRYCSLFTAVLAMTVLAVSLGLRLGNRGASPPSLDDWDIPTLVAHLNRAGLNVQLHWSGKTGVFVRNAYLTTTPQDWEGLNRLGIKRDPSRISEWRGVVYCEMVRKDFEPVLDLWGGQYLVAGPFVFYGDAELLERIRTILVPSAPPAAP